MKRLWSIWALFMVLSAAVFAQSTIISDNFSAGSVGAEFSRIRDTDIDMGWWANGSTYWAVTSDWSVVGGQLENSATNNGAYPDYITAEGGVVQVVSYSGAALGAIDISFDYSVAEGDTLYLHFWGLDGTFDGDGDWFVNIEAGDGAIFDDTDNAGGNDDGVVAYNLKDGASAPTLTGAAGDAMVALTGSGSYSNTIVLSSLYIPGVEDAADLEYFLVGFAKLEDEQPGTTSIDNLEITAVEGPPPPPVGIVWENDMSTDPVGDGWVVRGGTYTLGGGVLTMPEGAWATVLDTDPYNQFLGTTKIDFEWRATSTNQPLDSTLGAGLWVNVDGDPAEYGAIHFDSMLLADGTQTFVIHQNYIEPIVVHTGFGAGMLTLTATIDGFNSTIDYEITDGTLTHSAVVSYVPIAAAAGTTIGATLFTAGPSAEVDYVRVEANAAPGDVYFVAEPTSLAMQLLDTDSTVTGAFDVVYSANTNLDLTVTIADESHAGSFNVLSATPQVLDRLGSTELEIEFDRTANNLGIGETATGMVVVAWSEQGAGESGVVYVPVSGAVGPSPGTLNIWDGGAGTTAFGDADNWSRDWVPGTVGEDRAIIQHGGTVDVTSPLSGAFLFDLEVQYNTPDGSLLNIAADMPTLKALKIGPTASWPGFANQTAGAVTAEFLSIGAGIASTTSVYNLSGGALNVKGHDAEALTVGPNGVLNMSGGTITADSDGNASYFAAFTVAQGGVFEISGGTFVQASGRGAMGGTCRIVGDDATITMKEVWYGCTGTYEFILDETGVSTIVNPSWGQLAVCRFVVDGSAYTGGPGEMLLYDGGWNSGALGANYTVTGLGTEGVDWDIIEVVGSALMDPHQVILKIYGTPYEEWVASYNLTGAETAWDYDVEPDGENNWYEYVMGGDPTNASIKGFVPACTMVEDGGTTYMEYVYARRIGSTNELVYMPEFGSDLMVGDWATNNVVELPVAGALYDGYEAVTNRVDITGMPKGFMQLIVDEL